MAKEGQWITMNGRKIFIEKAGNSKVNKVKPKAKKGTTGKNSPRSKVRSGSTGNGTSSGGTRNGKTGYRKGSKAK